MKECHTCHICLPDEALQCPVDGGRLMASAIPGDTHLDGRYQLECRLGQGGMGVVYKARHVYLKSFHAVKVIIPELVGSDPLLPTRFRQEAIAAAAIRHQNVVAVTDYGVLDGTMPFLIMEFVKGRDLQDLLDESERLTTAQALDIMGPIASGVAAAHRQGIVHRDLKPLNIMVGDDMPYSEGVKVTDFGLAKIRSGDLLGSLVAIRTQGLVGSPYYMAPEQWEDRDLDARSDIYSLGIILYQMLTGKVPFRGNSIPAVMRKHLLEPPPVEDLKRFHVPLPIINVLRQALAKDLSARPKDAEEFLNALRQALLTSGSNLSRTFDPSSDGDMTIVGNIGDELEGQRLMEASQQAEAERLAAEAAFEEARLRAIQLRQQAAEAARRNAAAEAARRAEAERRARLQAEEEARRQAAEAEARQRARAEEARRQAEEEARQRAAAEEAQRQAEALRLAREEAARLSHEAETRRQAAEKAQRQAVAEAARRQAAEEEARNAREEAARFKAEQEMRRQAEQEAARQRAEVELRRQAEETARQALLETQRRAAEEAARRQADEVRQAREEAAHFKAEQEAAARRQAEAARYQAAQEAARFKAEQEARQRAEQEAARLRDEQAATARRLAQQQQEARAGAATMVVGHTTAGPVAPPTDQTPRPARPLALYAGLAAVILALGGIGLWFLLRPKPPTVPGGSVADPKIKAQKKPPAMVLMTGGSFQMGRSDVPATDAAYPAHPVLVPSFYLGITEVTNAQYAEFVRATGHAAPENVEGAKDYWTNWQGASPPPNQNQWPVRNVTVEDALAYARWRGGRDGVTYRLPTEAEWEYAARSGTQATLYPWGSQWRANAGCLNVNLPCPVGSYTAGDTASGLKDLLGNAWEWTASTVNYYAGGPNPATLSTADRQTYIVRGGSYRSDPKNGQDLTSATRQWQTGNPKHPTVGFRLAADAP